MVRRMDINTEQTIYRIAILFQRIAEESHARIDDQNIQWSVLTHEADDGITIGAIRLDGVLPVSAASFSAASRDPA